MRSKWLALFLLMVTCAPAQEYTLALPGYRFEFPRDYFNHEEYQTEWWYYTGNLRASDGHRFGFELTFFRQGTSRVQNSSPWFVHDLWMAHLALSDIDGQKFHHEERLNRAGAGIAGVESQTGLVWNGNWSAQIGERKEEIRAAGADFNLALQLEAAKPPVVHGKNGVSQKAEGAGHASHYFSLTRLLTSGSIQLEGKTFQVEGASWMDHEFFTGSMASNETGWDWLSIQLQDGSELTLYRLRHRDGSIEPYSSGSYVDADGNGRFLALRDFAMTPGADSWKSPDTMVAYPMRWHVSVPQLALELEITTPLRNQELTGKFGPSYWEGTIDVKGTRAGGQIGGNGYLEMTGYSEGSLLPGSLGSQNPKRGQR
jgi:predicted secreted hydrolase